MNLSTLSISRLKEWQACPQRYAFRHVDKLPEDEGTDPLYAGIGHVVHHCYAEGINQRKHPRVFFKEALDLFAKELKSLDPANMQRMKQMLESWDMVEPLTHGDEVFTELSFWINADISNEIINHGMIDLLVRRGDYLLILDWKTIKPYRQSKDCQIQTDPQLCLYAIAAAMLFNVPIKNVRSGLFFLENSRLVVVDWTAERVQPWLEETIRSGYTIKTTERETIKPTPNYEACRWCEYKSHCPDGRSFLTSHKKNTARSR